MTASSAQLERWPCSVSIPVAWGDMDALGHVNNTVYLRWFETARIEYFRKISLTASAPTSTAPILARTTIDFRQPVTFPDTVRTESTVKSLGRTSFVMGYRVYSSALGDTLAAEGESVVVLLNYATGTKVELGPFREAIEQFEHAQSV